MAENFLSNAKSVKSLTSLTLDEFESLEKENQNNIYLTIYDGERRKSIFSASPVPTRSFLLLTLFWLHHYPSLATLAAIFDVYSRTCSRIIRRTVNSLVKTFANEVVFPSDTEMSTMMFTYGQNFGFRTSVCIVDRTEIRISRPSNSVLQRKT